MGRGRRVRWGLWGRDISWRSGGGSRGRGGGRVRGGEIGHCELWMLGRLVLLGLLLLLLLLLLRLLQLLLRLLQLEVGRGRRRGSRVVRMAKADMGWGKRYDDADCQQPNKKPTKNLG